MQRNIVYTLFVLLMIATVAFTQQHELTRRDLEEMFYADTLPAPKAKQPATERTKSKTPDPAKQQKAAVPDGSQRRAGLKYRIQWSIDGSDIRDVMADQVFRANDKLRFEIQPNIDGYLYVIQRGSSGFVSTLFPYEGMTEGENRVRRDTPYRVPGDGWFAFDENPGQEQLMIILSRTPLQSLPARAIETSENYGFSPVVTELNGRVQSRDLKWFSEETLARTASSPSLASVVVNTNPDSNDLVYAEISLKHR